MGEKTETKENSNVETKIRFIREKAPYFRSYYVNGARGGSLGAYDIKLKFHSDHHCSPLEEVTKGKETKIIGLYDNEGEIVLNRIEEFELIISHLAAKELYELLGKLLEKVEFNTKELDKK